MLKAMDEGRKGVVGDSANLMAIGIEFRLKGLATKGEHKALG